MGFSEEEVKTMFEEAGVGGDFKYLHIGKGSITFGDGKEKVERSVFFARGTKAWKFSSAATAALPRMEYSQQFVFIP